MVVEVTVIIIVVEYLIFKLSAYYILYIVLIALYVFTHLFSWQLYEVNVIL